MVNESCRRGRVSISQVTVQQRSSDSRMSVITARATVLLLAFGGAGCSATEDSESVAQGNQLPALTTDGSPEVSSDPTTNEAATDGAQSPTTESASPAANTATSEDLADDMLALDDNMTNSEGNDSAGEATSDESPDGEMPVTEDETAVEDETAPVFSPCPTDGSPCRIMPLGDSITDGIDLNIGYSSNGGYRLELFRQATLDSHSITFVGTRPANGPATDDVTSLPFPRDHEGISGNTVAQVANRVDAALTANPPHIVLLQIGTNDLYQGMPGNLPGDLASLVDQITLGAPDALVVVAQITPLGGSFPSNGVPQYNATIPDMVENRVDLGDHVILVDMFNPIASQPDFVTRLLPDNIHPNAEGYAIMGATWYEAIEDFLP